MQITIYLVSVQIPGLTFLAEISKVDSLRGLVVAQGPLPLLITALSNFIDDVDVLHPAVLTMALITKPRQVQSSLHMISACLNRCGLVLCRIAPRMLLCFNSTLT